MCSAETRTEYCMTVVQYSSSLTAGLYPAVFFALEKKRNAITIDRRKRWPDDDPEIRSNPSNQSPCPGQSFHHQPSRPLDRFPISQKTIPMSFHDDDIVLGMLFHQADHRLRHGGRTIVDL